MTERHIILGPPGTGKTHTLLDHMQQHLEAGTPPERVGFVSFSRRAVREATTRAKAVVPGDLPHFRTIHSTAYHLLGLDRGDVLQLDHLHDFGDRIGLSFKGMEPDLPVWEGTPGDRCLALYALAKARQTSLEHEWREARVADLPWRLVRDVSVQYEAFKRVNGLVDFSDMIEDAEGDLPIDVLFVDEAQDTSRASWSLLRRVAKNVPVLYLAGDDDQAIYHWSGADPAQMLRFNGDRMVLPHSHRLPRKVKAFADRISRRICHRIPKVFDDNGTDGSVDWVPDITDIDLHGAGSWLLLARSNYQLQAYRQMARSQGVVYSVSNGPWSWSSAPVQAALAYERLRKGQEITLKQATTITAYVPSCPVPKKEPVVWADLFGDAARELDWMAALVDMPMREREYIRALRRGGESVTKPGRVRIGTVHSAKGAEADHVVLLTDVSERVAQGMQAAPDAEHRVQYVGATRSRQTLTLVFPQTRTFWSF